MTSEPIRDAGAPRPASDSPADVPHRQRSAWIRRLVILGLCLVAAYLIVAAVGKFDWSAVWDAVTLLAWWQLIVLLGLLLVRQVLNSLPLAIFIDQLSSTRALQNDLAAHLLAVAMPPPGDMVLRIKMFTSWGIDASRAVAGSLMNMLTFYIARFSMPLLGFLLILPLRFDSAYASSAAIGTGLALVIVVLIALSLRSEQLALRIGRVAGTAARTVKKSVDPHGWASWVLQFRQDVLSTSTAGFARAAVALVLLVLTDATILLLTLRFLGVSAGEVPAIELYAAFLCVYPLTLFPFMGIGIVDAVLLAAFVDVGGLPVEASCVAALIIWRAFTLVGPVVLGTGALALWRRTGATQQSPVSGDTP